MSLVPVDVKTLSKMDIEKLLVVQLVAANKLLSSELVLFVVVLEDHQRKEVES